MVRGTIFPTNGVALEALKGDEPEAVALPGVQ